MQTNYLVKVWGDFACFKSVAPSPYRVSYSCMTPTAAVGVLRSILGKHEICWIINKIYVTKQIKTLCLMTNEINHFGNGKQSIYQEDKRTQITNVILKDVEYVIDCSIELSESGKNNPISKYHNMFMYRIKRGKCFSQPYLGLKQYSANFELIKELPKTEPINLYLGRIPCSVKYEDGKGIYQFKEAFLENGVLKI